MEYVCDAPERKTWFRIENDAEAMQESQAMSHAVEKYFRREEDKARASYRPVSPHPIERDIGLKAHLRTTMPLFLTLRDAEGAPLATAMLPPQGKEDLRFAMIVVGPSNSDPFRDHAAAIDALGKHYKLALSRERCYPYRH